MSSPRQFIFSSQERVISRHSDKKTNRLPIIFIFISLLLFPHITAIT
jgi:hypothetical protein